MKKFLVLMAGIAVIIFAIPGTASAECCKCGDVNGDGNVNILDVAAMINWIYPPHVTPACPCAADVNCDNAVRVNCYYEEFECDDIEYLIDFLYREGPAPCDPDDDSVPDCDPCG